MRHLTLAALLLTTAAATPLPTSPEDLLRQVAFQNVGTVPSMVLHDGAPSAPGSTTTTTVQDPLGRNGLAYTTTHNGPVTAAVLTTANLTAALAFAASATGDQRIVNTLPSMFAHGDATLSTARFNIRARHEGPQYRLNVTLRKHPASHFSADEPLLQAGQPGKGTLRILTDYACTACRTLVEQQLPLWKARHPELRITVHAAPDAQKHPHADRAALYAQCVYQTRPRAFTAFDRALYRDTAWHTDTTDRRFRTLATSVGADDMTMLRCVTSEAAKVAVQRMRGQAAALKTLGIPTVYVNGIAMLNPASEPELRQLLDTYGLFE